MVQWTAHTGLSIYGLGGMPYLAAILFGWHHPALAQLSPLGRLLPVFGVVVWVIAIATWALFTRHHAAPTRVGMIAFVAGVTVWALGSAIVADTTDPRGRHLWVLAAVLALLPLCAFAPAVYQAASEPTRAETIDLTRPKLGWLITQPLSLLTARRSSTSVSTAPRSTRRDCSTVTRSPPPDTPSLSWAAPSWACCANAPPPPSPRSPRPAPPHSGSRSSWPGC
jgi:hypothetical protein